MYKNSSNIPISMAVWLAADFYDYDVRPNYISATSLLKPIRETILSRNADIAVETDISTRIASGVGTAVHTSIEAAWMTQTGKAMQKLGYPANVIEKIVINPIELSDIKEGDIPVYMEVRSEKKIGKWIIGGKFDFVIEDKLTDFKTTSVYTWIFGSNDKKYSQQGSIYRWLNPEKIKKDQMEIAYLFTDWSAGSAQREKNYPPSKILSKSIDLMSVADTKRFIEQKLSLIESFETSPQEKLPLCTSEDLWEKPAVFKYYKNPAKTTRSTKNFDKESDALIRKSADGNVGAIVEVKGEKVYCKYCSALTACTQAEQYILDGSLKI